MTDILADPRPEETPPDSGGGDVAADPAPTTVKNADGTVTVTLAFPVEERRRIQGGEPELVNTVTDLTFRRLTAGDLKTLDGVAGDMAKVETLICGCAGITPAVFAKLDAADFEAAASVIEGFMPKRRAIGATASPS